MLQFSEVEPSPEAATRSQPDDDIDSNAEEDVSDREEGEEKSYEETKLSGDEEKQDLLEDSEDEDESEWTLS